MLHLAVDIANYAGNLKPETVANWRGMGIERVVVRASTEDAGKIAIARQQMQTVLDGGLQLHAYEWLYFDEADPPEDQTYRVVENFAEFNPGRIWIDCEDRNPFTFKRTLEWIYWSMTIAGWAYGIYTGPWWWSHFAQSTTFFKDTPFWWAGVKLSELVAGRAAMIQIDSTNLAGVDVDLNLYKD